MFAMSFWESYVEGRKAWTKGKLGWKWKITRRLCFDGYHFYLDIIMLPLLIMLPLVVFGWDQRIFGVLLSAYFSGTIVEDFGWYIVNPKVKLREFWSSFSDYYPWIKIGKKKILPWGYVIAIVISILSWYFLWRL